MKKRGFWGAVPELCACRGLPLHCMRPGEGLCATPGAPSTRYSCARRWPWPWWGGLRLDAISASGGEEGRDILLSRNPLYPGRKGGLKAGSAEAWVWSEEAERRGKEW